MLSAHRRRECLAKHIVVVLVLHELVCEGLHVFSHDASFCKSCPQISCKRTEVMGVRIWEPAPWREEAEPRSSAPAISVAPARIAQEALVPIIVLAHEFERVPCAPPHNIE